MSSLMISCVVGVRVSQTWPEWSRLGGSSQTPADSNIVCQRRPPWQENEEWVVCRGDHEWRIATNSAPIESDSRTVARSRQRWELEWHRRWELPENGRNQESDPQARRRKWSWEDPRNRSYRTLFDLLRNQLPSTVAIAQACRWFPAGN